MPENSWNPWKMTTLGLLFSGATVLMTTLVLEYRGDQQAARPIRSMMHSNVSANKVSMPSQSDVEACNAHAQRKAAAGVAGNAGYEAAYRSCMHQKGY